jgi:ABC-type sugar transport system ATPase subunit
MPIVEMRGISKYYGYVVALDNVDFEVYPNEILALVGDNGAGKSTLIKVLSGIVKPDKGKIFINGEEVKIENPNDSIRLGIGTVYQDLALVDCLDCATNIFIGREPLKSGIFVDRPKMWNDARVILQKLKVRISSPRLVVGYLSGGQRQSLAIGRVISRECQIFLLDEPTASLGVRESNEALELIRELKRIGKSIIIISHNLSHVFSVADRFVVLRQGKVIGKRFAGDATQEEIVSMLTGAYDLQQ